MKPHLAFICLIAAMPSFVLGCSLLAKQKSVAVSCADFYNQHHITRQVSVAVGESFAVRLCSNVTTGFKWSESAQMSDESVLQQTSHDFDAPQGYTDIAGAPGMENWTFRAVNTGISNVFLEYGQPWEGGEKAEWTFNLSVSVE